MKLFDTPGARRIRKFFARLVKRPARRLLRREMSEQRRAIRLAEGAAKAAAERSEWEAEALRKRIAALEKQLNILDAQKRSIEKRALELGGRALAESEARAQALADERELLYGVFPEDIVAEPVPDEFRSAHMSSRAIMKLLADFDFDTVLDIGSGEGQHSAIFLRHGKKVTALDYGKSPYFERRDQALTVALGDFNSFTFATQFDCVWASHVLEHQANPNLFLQKVHATVIEGGVVAITVPPLKHQIVGGHVGLWNAGLLLYHLVLAGFDCRDACVLRYGYNISVIVRKRTIELPDLTFDQGDLRMLKPFLPATLAFASNSADDPFNGDIWRMNW